MAGSGKAIVGRSANSGRSEVIRRRSVTKIRASLQPRGA